jgi:spore maturation protein A
VLGKVFGVITLVALAFGLFGGRGEAMAEGVLEGASRAVEVTLTLAGMMCLWCGVMRVLEEAGAVRRLARLLRRPLAFFFPDTARSGEGAEEICANLAANLLGVGNAATPMGIRAAKRLVNPAAPKIATDELCRLIVLNTASIQLIPANVAAVRAGLGSASPFDILPAVWVTSLCSAGLGLAAAWLLGRVCRHA